jgi:hypothetical protein
LSVGDLQQPRDLVAESHMAEIWDLYVTILGQLRQAEYHNAVRPGGEAVSGSSEPDRAVSRAALEPDRDVRRWRNARDYALRQLADVHKRLLRRYEQEARDQPPEERDPPDKRFTSRGKVRVQSVGEDGVRRYG